MEPVISQGLVDLLTSLDGGHWVELPVAIDEDRARRIRIADKRGWIEDTDAVQGNRWRAYRLTPLGQAALDQHKLKEARQQH